MDDDDYYDHLNEKVREHTEDVDASGLGHNSAALIIGRIKSTLDSLVKLDEEHEEALQHLVDNQEEERETILLVLGRQLLEGRGTNKGDREFGKWCNTNFPNLSEHVNTKEVTAILWAAEFPERHQDMLDKHPRVRTTRGLYAKYKEEQKKDKVPTNGNSAGSGSGNTNSGSGNSGNNTGKPNEPPKDKGDVNTENPDTTIVSTDATMIASSLIGVVTNMLMFESTKGRGVESKELASAIFQEIRSNAPDQLTEQGIEEYIEYKLKRTLNVIMDSLPVLNGFETNVVSMKKTMENF
jgi:hypothetical protein